MMDDMYQQRLWRDSTRGDGGVLVFSGKTRKMRL